MVSGRTCHPGEQDGSVRRPGQSWQKGAAFRSPASCRANSSKRCARHNRLLAMASVMAVWAISRYWAAHSRRTLIDGSDMKTDPRVADPTDIAPNRSGREILAATAARASTDGQRRNPRVRSRSAPYQHRLKLRQPDRRDAWRLD
jgi:hypothetical protein